MASSSPAADATAVGPAPPMEGATSAAAAVITEPSTATSAPPSSPAITSTASGHDAVALAKAAAEAAATMASAAITTDAALEDASVGEEEEEEEAGSGKDVAKNPSRNWACSVVDEVELKGMEADGAILPTSESAPTWRSAFGDPTPTPISDERVLLFSHVDGGILYR